MASFSHGHRRRRAVSFRLRLTGREGGGTLCEKSAGAGHRAVSLHRDCVLVLCAFDRYQERQYSWPFGHF